MEEFLVFDLETQFSAEDVGGWGKIIDMRMSVGVIYDSEVDKYFVYLEDKVSEMIKHLTSGKRVIGFNHIGFDYTVLSGYAEGKEDKKSLYETLCLMPNLDLLIDVKNRVGTRIKLDNIAKPTLKVAKSADGMLALQWFKEFTKTRDIEFIKKITEYCIQDVKVTKDLYLFGLNNGYIHYYAKTGEMKRQVVDWSNGNSMINIRKETNQPSLV